jgi:polyphosphate kinase
VVGSNLDEFFMKRIGGLKQQVGAGVKKRSIDGMLPNEQIDACHQCYQEIMREQQQILKQLHGLLKKEGIRFCRYDELDDEQKKEMDAYFKREVFPLMTPQGIDPAHSFPFISNLSLNLLVKTSFLHTKNWYLNRVKVPNGVGIPRFIQVGITPMFITFEDLVSNNLDDLFRGLDIHSCEHFRVTRNAITERSEEQANDLLVMIEYIQWPCFLVVALIWESCLVVIAQPRKKWSFGSIAPEMSEKIDHRGGQQKCAPKNKPIESIT